MVIGFALMSAAVVLFATHQDPASDTSAERVARGLDMDSSPMAVQKDSRRAPEIPMTSSPMEMLLTAAARIDQATHHAAGPTSRKASTHVEAPDQVEALIATGQAHAQCCKVVKQFGGTIPSHVKHWWDTSSCAGRTWNATICAQAVTVSECCSAQREHGVVPGKTFGSMPQSSQGWWTNSGCDEIVTRNQSASLRTSTVLTRNQSASGGSNQSSENATEDVPKLCDLVRSVAEAAKSHTEAKSHTHETCSPFFKAPKKPTKGVDEHNGVALEDVCFSGEGPFHAFIIGDWGSLWGFKAAPHLGHRKERGQGYVWPIDNQPQILVRDQMRKLAPKSKPDYILNVGDDFYWGGIDAWCGKEDFENPSTSQFQVFFEDFYTGEGLDGKQWLGILGNHDYGGYIYHGGWDQIIGYTWNQGSGSSGRWMNPAQYWRSTVRYPDFSVDYYFLDTNVWDANGPWDHSPRNICGFHNGGGAHCPTGLNSTWICPMYFRGLWDRQKDWLDEVVPLSTADWRIVVTHFPPYFGKEEWQELAPKHGIDFVITGHRHSQFVRAVGDEPTLIWPDWGTGALAVGYTDFLDPTAWVVSGGGGGITSEHAPSYDGNDDQYGFMDMTLTKETLTVEAYSHSGILRHTITVPHQYRTTSTTMTNTTTSTTSTVTTSSTNESDAEEAGGGIGIGISMPWR